MNAPGECPGCGREPGGFAVQPHDVRGCQAAHDHPVRGLIRGLEALWSPPVAPLASRVIRRLEREKQLARKRGSIA